MLRRVVSALVALFALAAFLPAAAPAQQPQDEVYQELFQQGIGLLQEGKYDDSVAVFKKAIEIRKDLPESYYNIACAYSLKGDKERAIDWLAESLAHGFNDETHIENDSDLDAIRNEPRFKELMAKAFPKTPSGESLVTLKGEAASLEKLKGKVVIVDFWRTWCEPCKCEIPHLVALEKDLGARGLVVVGISNEPVALQEQMADELKMNYMLLRQTGPLPAPYDNVKAFPTKFILDREGKVVKKLVGARDRAELEAILLPLLAGAGEEKPKKKGEPQVF